MSRKGKKKNKIK